MVDLPQHLAAAFLVSNPNSLYILDLWPRPYVGLTYLWAALDFFLPLPWIPRLTLTAYAIGLVWAQRALLQALQRDPRHLLFAPLLIHGWPLAYGFLPFVFAVPGVLLGLALAVEPRASKFVLGLIHALVLLFHPVAWALLLFLGLLAAPRRTALGALGALPLLLSWVLHPVPAEVFASDLEITTWWRLQIKHQVLDFALTYLDAHWDHLVAAPGLILLAVVFFQGLRQGALDPGLRAFWGLLLLYLVAPADLALGSLRISILGPRLVHLGWLLLAANLRQPHARWHYFATLSGAAFCLGLTWEYARFGQRWEPRLEPLARLPKEALLWPQVAPAAEPLYHPRLLGGAESHLHAYSVLAGAYDPGLFSTSQSTVRISKQAPQDPGQFDWVWVQTATSATLVQRPMRAVLTK